MTSPNEIIKQVWRVGTRSSPLAQIQTQSMIHALESLWQKAGIGLEKPHLEVIALTAIADKITDRSLAEIGGKGLFSQELDEAMLRGDIDFAVHSLKDLETQLPDGIELIAIPQREDVADALLSHQAYHLDNLPRELTIGTASQRRAAMVKSIVPAAKTVLLRGNVQTRLAKLAKGEVDASFLAMAGLNRLGIDQLWLDRNYTESPLTLVRLDPQLWLPAAGQGALAVTCAVTAPPLLKEWLAKLDDYPTRLAITAERALLAAVDGTCRTPIAAHAWQETGFLASPSTLKLVALLFDEEDYSRQVKGELSFQLTQDYGLNLMKAAQIGYELGSSLKARLAKGD